MSSPTGSGCDGNDLVLKSLLLGTPEETQIIELMRSFDLIRKVSSAFQVIGSLSKHWDVSVGTFSRTSIF